MARSSRSARALVCSIVTSVSARLLGPLVEHVRGDAGLHVDHGDGVRDGVVHLAGDAQPFGVDPAPGLLLAGALGPLRPLLRLAAMTRRIRTDSPSIAAMTAVPIRKNSQPGSTGGNRTAAITQPGDDGRARTRAATARSARRRRR